MGLPSHSYGTSPAIWDQCYLPPDTSERACIRILMKRLNIIEIMK